MRSDRRSEPRAQCWEPPWAAALRVGQRVRRQAASAAREAGRSARAVAPSSRALAAAWQHPREPSARQVQALPRAGASEVLRPAAEMEEVAVRLDVASLEVAAQPGVAVELVVARPVEAEPVAGSRPAEGVEAEAELAVGEPQQEVPPGAVLAWPEAFLSAAAWVCRQDPIPLFVPRPSALTARAIELSPIAWR